MLGILTNIRVLFLIAATAVVAVVAASDINPLVTTTEDSSCAAGEERPCYDKGTKKDVKALNENAGENAFAACMGNGAENLTGTVVLSTELCAEEVVTYCFEGKSDNFIRHFDGTCQYEIPDLSTVHIEGKFFDAVTDEPVANVRVWDPETGVNNALDVSAADGSFEFDADTTSVTQTSGSNTGYSTGRCYFENWGLTSILRNTNDTLRLTAVQFDFKPGDLVINPLTSPDVDLGKVPLWPATGLIVSSDIPVTLKIPYEDENRSLGNTILRTSHKFSNVIPLEQPTVVELTDADGNTFTSPEKTYTIEKGCQAASLTFAAGEFQWGE